LNNEQNIAFTTIAKHSIKGKPEQLKMYLGGQGGTGKSTVVNYLQEFFIQQKQ
ncbi:hypothetical protein BDQ17DRAFT_1183941, partial [Cyathus striatus]